MAISKLLLALTWMDDVFFDTDALTGLLGC